MRGREEDGDGRDHRERRERDQAEPVDDHGGKLPVHDNLLLLIAYLHPEKKEKSLQ